MVLIERPSACDQGFCLHVFSVWNAAFANTRSGLGGTRRIFLATPVTLIKTPPPTPAQLFQVIPQFNYIPPWNCCCSDICKSDWKSVSMKVQSRFQVSFFVRKVQHSHVLIMNSAVVNCVITLMRLNCLF